MGNNFNVDLRCLLKDKQFNADCYHAMDEESLTSAQLSSASSCHSAYSSSSCDVCEINAQNKRQKGKNSLHKPGSNAASFFRSAQLFFGVSGVYVSYICYGVFQEQLFRYRSDNGDAFHYVWFLQVLESIASIVLGIAGRYFCGGSNDLPLKGILVSGISQVFSKVFCSMSLAAGLSFPVMTLAKSSKIVPVMLGQMILGGSRYGVRDCVFAGLLVTGTVLLSMGTSKTYKESDTSCSTTSVAFVLVSLFMDGCTGGLQKQLKCDTIGKPPTTYDFLLFTHLSMLATALLVSLATNDLWEGVRYVQMEPLVAMLVLKLCALSVMGQCFIFYIIAHFDSMVCATVTTTRKMWSILVSITLFQHHLTATGYSGLALALAGIAVEIQGKVLGER